ncbi:hypothetical protein HYH37_00385 [Clostridium botulinum]|uniref:hypothetical protein n=1 Tax=Clostridium botulinum TaxID=1491 RepID=UPI001C9A2FA9|nr:hypothetical protein [Clostridium botulinum]MBY6871669.1 hypothetical protein [Clostridium botulinum]
MAKYKKKPVIVEAKQLLFDTNVQEELCKWCSGEKGFDGGIKIPTLEGTMIANTGDYIIKGVNGEFYPCKPDIFKRTYELAE